MVCLLVAHPSRNPMNKMVIPRLALLLQPRRRGTEDVFAAQVNNLQLSREQERFLSGFVAWLTPVPVHADESQAATTRREERAHTTGPRSSSNKLCSAFQKDKGKKHELRSSARADKQKLQRQQEAEVATSSQSDGRAAVADLSHVDVSDFVVVLLFARLSRYFGTVRA